MNWFKQNRFFVTVTILVVGLGIFAPFYFAEAGFWSFIGGSIADGLATFFEAILGLFTSLFGLFVTWFADLLSWVFQIQVFTKVPAVQLGWTIVRDLANMFFILVLLLIGFATIIKSESYGIKKLLPRLIIVALLVNFSLLFAGVVIDIGNDLGLFFVSGGDPRQNIDIGANVMAAIGLQKTSVVSPELEATFRDPAADGPLARVINAIMRLVFTIVVAFLFAAMALIMVFRMIYLWILLIFLPLALVASIVPAGMSVWKEWTQNFLKWAFFPAIFGLFLYIGLLVGAGFRGGADAEILKAFGGAPSLTDKSGTFGFTLIGFLQYIVVVAIIFFGLIKANELGLAGAKGAIGIATKAKGKVTDWTKKGAAAPVKFAGRKTGEGVQRGAGAAAQALLYRKDRATGRRDQMRVGTEWLSQIPGLRQALRAPVAVAEARRKRVTDAEDKYKKMSTEHLQTVRAGRNSEEKVAIDRVLAERGKLQTLRGPSGVQVIDEQDIAQSMRVAATMGMQKELVMAAPDIALTQNVQTAVTINETLSKIKPKDIEKLVDGALGRYTAALAPTPAQLDNLAEEIGRRWGKNQIEKMMDAGQTENPEEIKNLLKRLGGSQRAILDRIGNPATAGGLGNFRFAKWLENSPGGADVIDLT